MKESEVEPLFNIFYNSVGKLSEPSKRVYVDGLVVWLGIKQELEMTSLRGSLEELLTPRARKLMGDCVRKEVGTLSRNPGALAQARQQVKQQFLEAALYSTFTYIRQKRFWNGYRVLGIDGSTVTLNKSNKELLKAFPGGGDHKRTSRWPLINLVLMVDLMEGVIVSAKTGAKYGKDLISEQDLAYSLLPLVDEKAVIVADRNYGTFNACLNFEKQGIKSLVRLNKQTAKYLNDGVEPEADFEKFVTWKCTADGARKYNYTAEDEIKGRLICKTIIHEEKEIKLCFFTTLEEGSVDELVELYKKRWSIETDIKVLKLQLRLKQVQSEKVSSVIVEMFCKFLSFNLTRGLVLLALEGTELEPRSISYTAAAFIMRIWLPQYSEAKTKAEKEQILAYVFSRIREAKIPKRPNRTFPRHAFYRTKTRYKRRSSCLKKTKRH